MRAAYQSEYRPGAADTSELDPCIAAETRLKKHALSTSKKRFLIGLALLALVFFIVILIILLATASKPSSNIHTVGDIDYEDMDSATLVGGASRTRPPTTTATTTVAKTERLPPSRSTNRTRVTTTTTTTRRPSTPRLMREEIVIVSRDEQPPHIEQRVNAIPVEVPVAPVSSSTTTASATTAATAATTTTTTTTARPTMRTRPSSVFPTVPLRGEEEEEAYERKTEEVKESCSDHATAALGSGVYRISPEGAESPFDVYCRMDEDDVVGESEGVFRAGAAWTYVQSLSEEAYFYNRTFAEYQKGFGRVDRSHWLGLEHMHKLAPGGKGERPAVLRIELYGDHCAEPAKCSGRPDGFWWGEWEFGLSPSDDLYRLHIAPATHGNLTVHSNRDAFYAMNNRQQFTTADRDNDIEPEVNCGQNRNYGGWWHKDCTNVALNGMYADDKSKLRYQVFFRAALNGDLKSSYHIHPKKSIMMVRPRM